MKNLVCHKNMQVFLFVFFWIYAFVIWYESILCRNGAMPWTKMVVIGFRSVLASYQCRRETYLG